MKKLLVLLLVLAMVLYGCKTGSPTNLQDTNDNTNVSEASAEVMISDETTPTAESKEAGTKESDSEDTGAISEESAVPESALESDETTKTSTDMQDSQALWGTFTPDTTENDYVQAVRKLREFESGTQTQTYEADYDGNGRKEAFVFCGEYEDAEFVGDLWFVDENMWAFCLEENMYAAMEQVYYKDFDRLYLLFSHHIGNPWATEMYTVRSGEVFNAAETIPGQKWVDEDGYIIVVQESYDAYYERYEGETEGLWTGHTWKFYPFYFLDGELTEVAAWETTMETVDKMAKLPEEAMVRLTDTEEKRVAATQFICREETRELMINIAYDLGEDEDISYSFENLTYRLTEDTPQKWVFVEESSGIYALQYSKESFWEFTDRLERVVPEEKEYINAYLSVLHKYRFDYPEDFETLMCDLIYIDENNIPEFIMGKPGYWISMYTYKDGTVYELMDMWVYGIGGNAGYEYIPNQNIMRNYDSDYAGLVMYTSYATIDEKLDLEESSYYLKMSYEDENGKVIEEYSEENYDESNWHYYYGEEEITAEEYDSYIIDSGEFQYMEGTQSYYPFEDWLCYLLDGDTELPTPQIVTE